MPPPKRPKKSLTWMNELLTDNGEVSGLSPGEQKPNEMSNVNVLDKADDDSSKKDTNTGCADMLEICKDETGVVSRHQDITELPGSTTMVRSDSMSSTDSLKENKEPLKPYRAKATDDTGPRSEGKMFVLGGEDMTVGVLKPAGNTLGQGMSSLPLGKQPALKSLLVDHSQPAHVNSKDRVTKPRRPLLEGLLSVSPSVMKCEQETDHQSPEMFEVENCKEKTVQGIVLPMTKPKPHVVSVSTVAKSFPLECDEHVISRSPVNHSSGRQTATSQPLSGKKWHNAWIASKQLWPNNRATGDVTNKCDASDVPPLVPLEYDNVQSSSSSAAEHLCLSAGSGLSDKLSHAYLETGKARINGSPLSVGREKDDLAVFKLQSDPQTVKYTSFASSSHEFGKPSDETSLHRRQFEEREGLTEREEVDNFKGSTSLPSTSSVNNDHVLITMTTNTSNSSRRSQNSDDSRDKRLSSSLALHSFSQQRPTSLTQCINNIVTNVLLSEKEKEQDFVLAKSSSVDQQYADRHSKQTESPPGEYAANYRSPFRNNTNFGPTRYQVLTPCEQNERQSTQVPPPCDCKEYRLSMFSPSTSRIEEPDSMSTRPFNTEHYVAENTVNSPKSVHSPHTSSPRRDGDSSELHSPNTEISSSTSDVDKKPINNGTNLDDVKSASHLCQVCNDAASGFHYGVWSCEGCKAFFKRSLQGPVNYICPATNSCTIDKHRRKSCQACRLRKCIEMGMSRGNCREKKGPNQRQMKRKSQDSDVKSETSAKVSAQYSEPSLSGKREPQVCSVRPLVDPDSRQSMPQTCPAPSTATDQRAVHPLVSHLLKIEPPIRLANHDNLPEQNADSLIATVLHLTDTELMDIVAWARGIPGYMELPLIERMQLLEFAWMEILILGVLWRSISQQDTLVLAPDLLINRESLSTLELVKLFDKMQTLINVLRQNQLNNEEMVLLRACILLNAGVQNLNHEKYFQELQDKVHSALHYTTIQRGKHPVSRMTRLLLFLPQLRQVSLEVIAVLSKLQQQGKLPSTTGLIAEILSKHNATVAELC